MKTPIYCRTGMRDGGGRPDAKKRPRQQEKKNSAPFLLCRQCLHPITVKTARIAVNGAHQHSFANPHGIVFDIGCFQTADGCASVGAPTDEFTWFGGYRWRVALCGACMTHMGWLFTASTGGGSFFGLILDHLIESER